MREYVITVIEWRYELEERKIPMNMSRISNYKGILYKGISTEQSNYTKKIYFKSAKEILNHLTKLDKSYFLNENK